MYLPWHVYCFPNALKTYYTLGWFLAELRIQIFDSDPVFEQSSELGFLGFWQLGLGAGSDHSQIRTATPFWGKN